MVCVKDILSEYSSKYLLYKNVDDRNFHGCDTTYSYIEMLTLGLFLTMTLYRNVNHRNILSMILYRNVDPRNVLVL
jgi:hypothetical protein